MAGAKSLTATASQVRRIWSLGGADTGLAVGVTMLALIGVLSLLAPLISPYDPLAQNLYAIASPPSFQPAADGLAHVLGTDQLGRDILSRLLHGGRLPLAIGIASVLFAGLMGTALGVIAGYYGGWVDQALSRLCDSQLSIPSILLAITILAFGGRSLLVLVLVIALAGWPTYFRICRAVTLQLRNLEFVAAAVAAGFTDRAIIVRHLLPNLFAVVATTASLDLARAILMEAGLTYLGLGVPPPAPDWAIMVSEGQDYLPTAWWIATIPGLFIVMLVLAANLIGDHLGRPLSQRN